MNEKLIKMSLEDLPKFVNDTDPELAIAKSLFLSTRPNSHGFIITEEVLKEYAPSILGKFLVGNLNVFETDVTTHLKEPNIFGYIPSEQEIEFVRANDGYLDAYVNIVVSKIYATRVYDLFIEDNFRNVSVEMMLTYADEEEKIVSKFNVCGLTVLGKSVNPSVPNAYMEIVQFSADKAEKFYQDNFNINNMMKLADVGKRYKINKSAKAMSDDDWSNVDKTKLRNTILEAQNKSTLIKSVYLKVESGWEEAPSERLKYPVMQLKGDTFVYNRNALANAKARATQQNETEVLSKLNSIYNKLNLKDTDDEEQTEDKMAKLEDKEKDVVMDKPTDEKVKEEAKLAEVEEEKKDEEAKLEEVEKAKCEDKEDDKSDEEESDKKEDDDKEDEKKMSDEEQKLCDKLAECEAKMSELENELTELRKFKADTEEEKKMSIVSQTLAEVKSVMQEDDYAKFAEKANTCTLDNINAWRNEVLANVTTVLMSNQNTESHLRMNLGKDETTPTSLWDRF